MVNKKTLLILVVVTTVAVASAVMLIGATYTFQGKMKYLSRKYVTLEISLSEYQVFWMNYGIDVFLGGEETKDWSLFKSKLRQVTYDGSFAGTVWYDRGALRIWFTYNRGGRATVFMFRASTSSALWPPEIY